MMKINFNTKVVNEAYRPYLLDYSHRYNIFYGGGGSGKSHFVFQRMVLKALRDKRKILVIRKIGTTLKDSVWQMTLDTLENFQILGHCKTNKTNLTIELPGGSQFLFKGLDDPEKIKSIAGITDIIIEEATELNYEDFNQLDIRLRHPVAKDQEIILMFNPVSKLNWCYKHWFERPQEPLRTAICHTTYKDNKFLPQSQIDTLEGLKTVNETYYRIYALGEFGSLNKLVFTNWAIEDFSPADIKGEVIVGLDFGYVNDPTAIMCSILDEPNKKLYVFEDFCKTGMLNDEIAQVLKDKGLHRQVIMADSAEQKSIEEIRRRGIYKIKECSKGPGSVLQGIQQLQQYKIIVLPSCKNIIEELQNYSWTKDRQTGEYINKPVDKYNHCLDGLRYSLQCIGNRLSSAPKSKWGL
jgi:phage terminase large subunit